MNLKRIYLIFKARNKEFYRDPGAIGWVFLFPFLMVIGFGYFFDMEDTTSVKAGFIVDQNELPNIGQIEEIAFENEEEALEKLRMHKLDMVVSGNTYYINKDAPKSVLGETIYLQHISTPPEGVIRKEVEGNIIKYIDWLMPGLLTFNGLWMALWGVGWVIVRQRKLGVLKRLKASPVTAAEYLFAQVFSRMIVLLISAVIVYAGACLIHPFKMLGSYFDFFFIYLVGCFSMSALGLIIAAQISSEELANGLLNLLTYPMMFFSEIWFSLEGSSEWVIKIAHAMPLWHMTDIMRLIMHEGATLYDFLPSLIYLTVIGVVGTFIGAYLFKWNKT